MKMTLTLDRSGQFSARQDGHLFVLSKYVDSRDIKLDGEFMIVSRLGKHPKGWVVEPVTDEYILVEHKGFECSGSMCATMASLVDGGFITPGRLNGVVRTADNVNVGWNVPVFRSEQHKFDPNDLIPAPKNGDGADPIVAYRKIKRTPLTPGKCYVKRGETRLAGVPSLAEILDDVSEEQTHV